jgi:protein SCO1/2
MVRIRRAVTAAIFIVAWACAGPREYELRGQIIALDTERREVTIKHEDIRGFMPGMTMPFKVKDARLMDGRIPGDLVRAKLVVEENTAYLSAIERTGHAPVTKTPVAHMDVLETGDQVPDAAFVDQSGAARRFSSWAGQLRAVTFMYTRCPLPNFCPLMDRHFAALQRDIAADSALRGRVHLTSVSIDPAFDTPPVLAAHARRLAADAAHWSFLTGDRQEIERFAARFGVSIMREDPTGQDIVHNLRTAVVDREGRLVKMFGGNDWTPAQVLAELKAVAVR